MSYGVVIPFGHLLSGREGAPPSSSECQVGAMGAAARGKPGP